MRHSLVVLVMCGQGMSICYPGEDLAKCAARIDTGTEGEDQEAEDNNHDIEDEDLISVRGTNSYQQSCSVRGASSYHGACKYPSECKKRSYAYSPTCGLGGLICCQGSKATRTKQRTTTRPRPASRPSKTSEGEDSLDDYKDEVCGVPGPGPQIIGGSKAGEGKLPFMVALVTGAGSSFCGGVLVTRKHVLTAAHCFDIRDWRSGQVEVRVGQADLSKRGDRNTRDLIRSVKVHEKYEKRGRYPSRRLTPLHDIAIITLDRVITSKAVYPVCLGRVARGRGQAIIAGWGQDNREEVASAVPELRYAKVDTISAKTCQARYTSFVKNPELVLISEDMLCAGDQHADACAGDSGGPLLYNTRWTSYRWTVYGVVSFGPKICGNAELPGVYTRVDKYLHWIEENTRS